MSIEMLQSVWIINDSAASALTKRDEDPTTATSGQIKFFSDLVITVNMGEDGGLFKPTIALHCYERVESNSLEDLTEIAFIVF